MQAFAKKMVKGFHEIFSENHTAVYYNIFVIYVTRYKIYYFISPFTQQFVMFTQDFCGQEIRTSLRYQRKYYEKQRREMLKDIEDDEHDESIDIDTGQKIDSTTVTDNMIEDDTQIDSTLRRENSRRVSKLDFGERLKKMKSKVQNTMQRAKPSPIINGRILSMEEEFLPPPTARPKVKTRPVREEDYEINFSGKLQSTVLRLHCENCVLKDKPEEFQSVLFVCQL